MKKNTIEKFIDLGNKFKDLSRKYFGWNDTYVDLEKMILTEDCRNMSIYRFYFAGNSDHTDAKMRGVSIAYHSIPEVSLPTIYFNKLEQIYEQSLSDYKQIEKNMKDQEEYQEQDEKKQKIEALKKQIEELETNQ